MNKFIYITIIAFLATSSGFSESKPSCAVVPFTAGTGFTDKQAASICRNFTALLIKSGEYNVMPDEQMMNTIKTRLPKKPASITPYFVIAGRILKVDYVITGTIEATNDALWLKTALCDVKGKVIKKRVKIFYKGNVDSFLKLAADANLKRMLETNASTPVPAVQKIKTVPVAKTKVKKPTKPDSASKSTPDMKAALTTLRDYSEDNLQVGLRMNYYMLLKDEKESFLGSINQLKEDQDLAPHLFARIKLPVDPFWITVGWNRLRARTWTKAEPEYGEEGYTDGTIELSGPFMLLYFENKQDEDLTWFGEVGFAAYGSSFEHDSAWQNAGYAGSHVMEFEDTYGLIFNGGCIFKVKDNIRLNTYFSYTRVSVDMTYYLHGNKHDERIFPLSNVALGLGVQYDF